MTRLSEHDTAIAAARCANEELTMLFKNFEYKSGFWLLLGMFVGCGGHYLIDWIIAKAI